MTCPSFDCSKELVKDKIESEEFNVRGKIFFDDILTTEIDHTRIGKKRKIQVGVTLPGWKTLVKNGKNATTPYTNTVLSYKVSSIPSVRSNSTRGHHGYREGLDMDIDGTYPYRVFPSGFGSDAYVNALTKARESFYQNARSAQHKAQALVPIVEFRDFGRTVGTISDKTKLVAQALKQRSIKMSKRDFISHAADVWLTWSFGIKPMIKDAEDIANSLARSKWGAQPPQLSVIGKGAEEYNSHESYEGPYGWWGGAAQMKTFSRDTISAKVKIYHSFPPSWFDPSKSFGDTAENLGFSLGEVPSAAWELLSYSWLIDYFSNIQRVLDAFAMQVPPPNWGYVNYKGVATRRYYSNGEMTPGDNTTVVQGLDVETQRVEFIRDCSSHVPIPFFRIKDLDEISAYAGNKLANLLAVLDVNRRRNVEKLLNNSGIKSTSRGNPMHGSSRIPDAEYAKFNIVREPMHLPSRRH